MKFLVVFLLTALLTGTSLLSSQGAPKGSPVARWGALHVEGTLLTSQKGEPVNLRGMSLFDTSSYGQYANPKVLAWLRDDWKATVFRAAMYTDYNGHFVGEAGFAGVFSAIEAAIETGLYVIVDWHILSAGNPLTRVDEAKAFFQQVAQRFGSSPNVVYEICNEPNGKGVTWADAIKPYALQVIPVIRALAPDTVVIVGTPVWSSQPEVAAAAPLPFGNLLYTLHFYAGSHDLSFLDRIDKARALGAGVFVTEWGTMSAQVTGPLFVPESVKWVEGLAQRGISWANWSLGTKLEPASALKPLASVEGRWSPGDLTESGLLVRSLLRGEVTGPVFADNFDSENFKAGGWVRSGALLDRAVASSGPASVRFDGGATLKKPLLSAPYRHWHWSLLGRGEGWGSGDRFLIEWSSDGQAWKSAATLSSPNAAWTLMTGDLPAEVDGRPGIQVRLRAEFAATTAHYWVDDVVISATRD